MKIVKNSSFSNNCTVVLDHCNVGNHDYQQNLKVMYTVSSNKSFGQFLDIFPKCFMLLKTFNNSEFQYIEVWFTDQDSKLLEVEDKIDITLLIK